MTAEHKTYTADAELEALIESSVATGNELWIIAGGKRYRISITSADRTRPDAETVKRSIEGIRAAAGGWRGLVDAEEFKAYIAERRRQPGRPPVEL